MPLTYSVKYYLQIDNQCQLDYVQKLADVYSFEVKWINLEEFIICLGRDVSMGVLGLIPKHIQLKYQELSIHGKCVKNGITFKNYERMMVN